MDLESMIHKSYLLIFENFQNARLLDIDQLLYLLSLEVGDELTREYQDEIKRWVSDFMELSYIKQLIIDNHDMTEIFLTASPYFKTNRTHEKFSIPSYIPANYLQLHLEIIAHNQKQDWNFNQPFKSFFCQFELINDKRIINSRITLVHHSVSTKQLSYAFIRIIPSKIQPLESFSSNLDQSFYQEMIKMKRNILIAGATGSGKTSFLSSLLQHTPDHDHLICLEDTQEIIPPKGSTQMIASSQAGKTMEELCGYTLRMSPDRVILGEMRSKEIIPFFLMMNTGHRGLMSTIHSNSAIDAIHRCAFLFSLYSQGDYINYNQALKMIAQNIDYVIYLKDKKVIEIIKVLGTENADCFYETVCPTPNNPVDLSRNSFIRNSFGDESIYS